MTRECTQVSNPKKKNQKLSGERAHLQLCGLWSPIGETDCKLDRKTEEPRQFHAFKTRNPCNIKTLIR